MFPDSTLPRIPDYELAREIGRGAFGRVFLARSKRGEWRAVKVIEQAKNRFKNHEKNAAALYLRSRGSFGKGVIAIEDFHELGDGTIYYVMPLADPVGEVKDPQDPAWRPMTLEAYVEKCRAQPGWFSIAEVRALMKPLLEGLAFLEEAGLCHRDIKPSNILFIKGVPTLADISLLEIADENASAYGTDYFRKPASMSCNPDYWSLSGVLFYILSGKSPQFWNWSNHWKPPQGNFHTDTQKEYQRLRSLILNRSTTLQSREQYRSAIEFRNEVLGRMSFLKKKKIFLWAAVALVFLGIYTVALLKFSAPDPYPEILPLFPKVDRAHSLEGIIRTYTPYCLREDEADYETLKNKAYQYAVDANVPQILEFCQEKARANKKPPEGKDAPSALLLEFLKLPYDDMKFAVSFLAATKQNDKYFSRQEWAILLIKTFYENPNRYKLISGASEIFHRLHKDYPDLIDAGPRTTCSYDGGNHPSLKDLFTPTPPPVHP